MSTPRFMPISHHADEVVAVTRGYGEASKPEDFLDSFCAFVRDPKHQHHRRAEARGAASARSDPR